MAVWPPPTPPRKPRPNALWPPPPGLMHEETARSTGPDGAGGHRPARHCHQPGGRGWIAHLPTDGQSDRYPAADLVDWNHLARHDAGDSHRGHRFERGEHAGALDVPGGDGPDARLGGVRRRGAYLLRHRRGHGCRRPRRGGQWTPPPRRTERLAGPQG